MKPRISAITLPVDDLTRSITFYRDGLGLPADDPGEADDHVAIPLEDGLYLVLIRRPDFSAFTRLANLTDAARGAAECILSYFAGSREEVDALLDRAEAVGGTRAGQPQPQPWGYAGYLTDPDGHLWEIMWNAKLNESA